MSEPGAPPSDERSGDTGFAAGWSPETATRTFAPSSAGAVDLPFLFAAGQRFGPYVIVRPIGKGGMGQVYEAEESESGRRIALKILSRGIGDEEERERFLTEGRIAASLSHPNLVYVFGTTEVHGLPVIAMELAPSGTLKDLVTDDKPLAPAAAVDAILQVIAGLETAAAAGILHRDIKPSNCFVAADGRVLVGDFGLSVATLGRAAEHPGAAGLIAGTPGFASPEQLRGERLDVRSDIYSVGATLYYLLTGRVPIEHDTIAKFVTGAATDLALKPPVLPPTIPKKLAAIVTQCLAPAMAGRIATYSALAAALEPFRSTTRVPAGLVRRLAAGAVDAYIASLPAAPIKITVGGQTIASSEPSLLIASLPTIFSIVVYYGLLEGFLGAAAGKGLFRLRVVQRDGTRPGFLRAAARAAVFLLPVHLATQAVTYWMLHGGGLAGAGDDRPLALAVPLISCALLAALFSTARRRNGYAALQDLASGTRVVRYRRKLAVRGDDRHARERRAVTSGPSRIGPFVVSDDAIAAPVTTASLIDGYDDRLRRPVWIVRLPAGTPPLATRRRDLSRPGRSRWLAGRRSDEESWDAFEATDGASLLEVATTPQPWSRVRHWLADLSHEVVAGLGDSSLPVLDLDRVWIGADGRARLLDWPVHGAVLPAAATVVDLPSACRFLHAVAAHALGGAASTSGARSRGAGLPLPIAGRDLLVALRDARLTSVDELSGAVDAAMRTPAAVSRTTRASQLAMCAALPIVAPAIAFYALTAVAGLNNVDVKSMDLLYSLERVSDAHATPKQREALEIYIATRLKPTVEDPLTWTRPFPELGRTPGLRAKAERIIVERANSTPEATAAAEAVAESYLAGERAHLEGINAPGMRRTVLRTTALVSLCVVAVLALAAALVMRYGLAFRAFGTALVRRDGADPSRARALARASIAWLPVLLIVLVPRVSNAFAASTKAGVALVAGAALVIAAGAAFAIVRPARGIPDRLAGTWIVPK